MEDSELADPVRWYLSAICQVPLLTAEREVDLAKRMKRGFQARMAGPAGGEEVLDGVVARGELISANLRLVVSIAKHYAKSGLPLMDLVQEGNIGLLHAADRFDYQLGFKFSTYATWWIRQAITRALSERQRSIRLPVHMVETIIRVGRVRQRLLQDWGREPTAEEIAIELGISTEKVQQALYAPSEPVSLDLPVGDDEKHSLGDLIEGYEQVEALDTVANDTLKEQVQAALRLLNDQERAVLRLRFGFEGNDVSTLEEVGKAFRLSRERVRQVEAKALRKLRLSTQVAKVKDFVA